MRLHFRILLAIGLILSSIPATAQPNRGGRPGGQQHYQHPAAPHAAPVVHQPVPHTAPDQFHPASRPVQEYTPRVTRNVTINTSQMYRDVTNYHINRYHTTVNVTYAARPGSDRGYWGNGWYHGYWHDYWLNQDWTNWGGHYGFWFNLDGVNVFLYEYSPGVCWYWNGYQWLPWWNPPYTPYYCPY
jgi:hypothetical protein